MAKKRAKPKSKPATRNAPPTSPSGPPPEAFAALDTWAGEVAACLPQSELGVLLGIYRKLAGDKRVSADNRKLAAAKVDALRRASRRITKKNNTNR